MTAVAMTAVAMTAVATTTKAEAAVLHPPSLPLPEPFARASPRFESRDKASTCGIYATPKWG